MRTILAIGALLTVAVPSARGQMAMPGGGRSLGGYGASAIGSYYGGSGGSYVPYNGRASGFVPYGGGSGVSGVASIPRRLPQTPVGGSMMATTPIGGASLSGGMGMGSGSRGGLGMGQGSGGVPRGLVPFGYEGGLGMGGGMSAMPSGGSGGMGPKTYGPGFGWPFRMPPSLGGGSSMAMP